MGKHSRNLKGAHETETGNFCRFQSRDVGSAKHDPASCRRQEFGEKVEHRRLAGTVRSDQRVNRPLVNRKRHIFYGKKSAELHGESRSAQDRLRIDHRAVANLG